MAVSGEAHWNWKGGISKDSQGYLRRSVHKDHPCAISRGNGKHRPSYFAYDHNATVFDVLGRWDKKWHVHHRNELRYDNTVENLIVFTHGNSDHMRYHKYLRSVSEAEALAYVGLDKFIAFDDDLVHAVEGYERLLELEREAGIRLCRRCKIKKHVSDFNKSSNTDGLSSYCKLCDRQKAAENRAKRRARNV